MKRSKHPSNTLTPYSNFRLICSFIPSQLPAVQGGSKINNASDPKEFTNGLPRQNKTAPSQKKKKKKWQKGEKACWLASSKVRQDTSSTQEGRLSTDDIPNITALCLE